MEEVLKFRLESTPRWASTVDRWRPHPSPAVLEPHTEALPEGQRPEGEGRDKGTSLRILMAEDERIIGADLRQRLRRMGHTVVGLVASGEEAIAYAHRCQPDLVLMDIRLPGRMDGVEAAEHIRTQLDMPVVFMTAYPTVQTLQRVWRTRPAGYLSKPFDESQLRQAIERAVETQRRTRPKRPRR